MLPDGPVSPLARLPLSLRLPPRLLRRRAGLGSIVDFQTLNQPGSDFAAAWSPIAQQITAEGGKLTDLQAAANDFTSSFEQLTSSASGFGLETAQALTVAAKYTKAGRTVLGAVQHVSGLVQAAEQVKTPAEVAPFFQMFTGTLIGAAVAAGAVSAGVGSLIVAGIGVALNLLESAGLFGTTPSGVTVCSQGGSVLSSSTGVPTVQVGCAYSTTASVVNAGSANWRSFPNRSSAPGWFNSSQTRWYGDVWSGWSNLRLIDSAFPEIHYLSCMTVPPELTEFQKAFASAWIANKEYALNGLKAQSDAEVLLHVVRIWNRAHEDTSTYDLSPATFTMYGAAAAPSSIVKPSLQEIAQGHFDSVGGRGGGDLCSPDGNPGTARPPYYAAVLMNQVRNLVASDDSASSMVGGNLRIHTGGYKPLVQVFQGAIYKWNYQTNQWDLVMTAAQVTALEAAIAAAEAKIHTTTAPSPYVTAALVGGGAVVAAAAGGSLYAVATGQRVDRFWMELWGRTLEGGAKALRAVGVRL